MKGRDLLSVSLRVIGLLFVGVGAIVAVSTLVFYLRAERVPATIVDYSIEQNSIGLLPRDATTGTLYYPIVEYRGPDGSSHRITARRGRTIRVYEIGSPVAVLALPDDPSVARMDSIYGVWGSSIVLGGLGAIFLLVSVLAPFGFGGSANARRGW